jgi:hypothetical protein
MNFKPKIWVPIATVLSVVNVAAVWFAAQPGEPLHATTHAVLGVAFGLWAQRLRQQPRVTALQATLDELQLEANAMRQELGEAQTRLDFAERMLAQGQSERRP